MSQAEDLLNSLNENDISTKTEPHIVVGSNRVITVPSELKRIAVQYDHNIETVTFDCPRYWDDHDMSTMKVYINYTRADNEPGCYIADDVAVDETDTSIMHFSWTISRHVTEAVGPLTILVCIKMVDADGNEVNHWNSERNTDMTISQGMECGDIIVNKYPDVITYLLEDMGNLADLTTEDKSSLVAAINEAAASGGVQSDWNQNDSTQPDYVKNRPFHTDDPVETVLVEESTVRFTDIGGMYTGAIESTFSPTVGNAYKVYWDGTDYESACVEVRQNKCIGNLSIDGSGPNTGEPFLMLVRNQQIDVATLNYASYHTISISRFVLGVVKIDEKYLPDTVATKSEVEAAQTTAENAQTTANAARNTADAAISYDSQTLTTEQQKQARTNIGAGQPVFVVNVTTMLSEQGDEVYTADKTAAEIETAYQEGCEIVCRMSVPIIGMGLVPVQLPLASRRGRQIFMFAINQTMWTDKSSRIVSYLVTIADDGVNVGQNNTEIYIKPASGIPKSDLEQSVQTSLDKADTAISLGLTTATPGQIIKVKTVQDGKPTEWEAVDMDAEKIPKFTKLLTHTITEDELAASPIAFVWGTAQIPNLNDFNVFVLTIVRPDGAKIEFNKWVRLKINSTLFGNICGTATAASSQYAITANRLFGAWISGNYYDPRNIGVPVLVPPGSSSTFQSNLPDSEPVTSIGFTSYVADYGLTAGIVVEIWGAK